MPLGFQSELYHNPLHLKRLVLKYAARGLGERDCHLGVLKYLARRNTLRRAAQLRREYLAAPQAPIFPSYP